MGAQPSAGFWADCSRLRCAGPARTWLVAGRGPLGALGSVLGGLLAPPVCWSCSGLSRRGDPLCGSCRASLHRLAPDPVLLCGVPVWAPLAYSGPARDLVRALKFRGAIALADAMAAQIVANAPPAVLDDRTLVPVPLHPRRLRSRGYNQAGAIADAAGRPRGSAGPSLPLPLGPLRHAGRPRPRRAEGRTGRWDPRRSRAPRARCFSSTTSSLRAPRSAPVVTLSSRPVLER